MSFTSRWGDVYLASAARGISTCGDFLAATALALALQQAGAGGTAVAALLLAASLPLVLLAPVTGRIADRYDSRLILIAAGLAQAAVCLGLAVARQPVVIIVLVALLACGLAVTQPTLSALLPEMVRPADLARASGVNQTAGSLGMLLAPALAGILVGQFGTRVPLLVDAVSYLSLVAAGLLIRTRRNTRGRRPAATAAPDAVRAGPGWSLRADRLLAAAAAAVAVVVGAVGAINVIDVFFVRESLAASTTVYGVVGAAWTAGMLAGAVLFGRLGHRAGHPGRLVRGMLLVLAGMCATVLAAATVGHALLLVPLWLLGGACNGGLNVFISVVVADRVPPAARGRAWAVLGAVIQGAGMVGFLLGGVLVDRFDPRPLVAAAGAAGLVAVLGCTPFVRRALRREADPARR
ncbi:MFS transporter [Micromonospora zhanjiangensis]|uniref:MFS transporter n=1 Tax=Micromonospora zhanjiangensis TaxID=1522057 RepID=A0ABV8KX49_9ACTN